MINFHFKKVTFGELPKADPSFYKRFHMAWINFQENELETRLQTVEAGPKKRKPHFREAFQ
jgi:hypothetical protein